MKEIRERLSLFNTLLVASDHQRRLYEAETVIEGPERQTERELPPGKWLYWVVTFSGQEEIASLQIAFALLRNDLLLDMVFARSDLGTALSWYPGSVFHFYSFSVFQPLVAQMVTRRELEEVRQAWSRLKEAYSKWPNLYKSAARFKVLGEISERSEIKVIGYFSVIESLMTHAPELTEPMDSLTHQMKTKMNLLRKMFPRPMDYQNAFGVDDGDKVWSKLYDYRGKLAHGDDADFEKGLRLLKSRHNAMAFLRETAKLLLLVALREPQLIADLKRC